MEIKDKWKEIDTKNCTCYYFDVKIIFWIEILILVIFYWTKNYINKNTKIF